MRERERERCTYVHVHSINYRHIKGSVYLHRRHMFIIAKIQQHLVLERRRIQVNIENETISNQVSIMKHEILTSLVE